MKKSGKKKTRKKNRNREILDNLAEYLSKLDFHPTIIKDIMDICSSSTVYIESKNTFSISFEVNAFPTWTAVLTQKIIEFALAIGFKVEIYECYAVVFDDNDQYVDVLYGEDAMIYYETGEMPDGMKEKIANADVNLSASELSLKADAIFEQISKKGMKSLKKGQKEFLVYYSKKLKSEDKKDGKECKGH